MNARPPLVLLREKWPRPSVGCVTFGGGHPDALEAARRGDIKRLDELEIACRNLLGPRPALSREEEEAGLVPVAAEILHGFGPRGETAVRWIVVEPCPRCFRRWSIRATCHRCSGLGHLSEEWEWIYTTLDGEILEETL